MVRWLKMSGLTSEWKRLFMHLTWPTITNMTGQWPEPTLFPRLSLSLSLHSPSRSPLPSHRPSVLSFFLSYPSFSLSKQFRRAMFDKTAIEMVERGRFEVWKWRLEWISRRRRRVVETKGLGFTPLSPRSVAKVEPQDLQLQSYETTIMCQSEVVRLIKISF